jgi:large subunit ribosomal protein L1
MSKDDKKVEAQAAAEERDEILELENEDNDLDVSSVPTPEDTQSSAGKPVKRDPESAEEGAKELTEDNSTDTEDSENSDAEGTDESDSEDETEAKSATAKAGKRSAKAQREAEEETASKEAAQSDDAPKPRVIHVPNQKKRHGKNYLAAQELINNEQQYELAEAIDLAKQTSRVKFDASVELHINLGVDPRQADQMVRATVVLPAGTGKKLRVAVLAPADKHADAKKAGADIVSDGDLIAQIEKGQLNFDILVATPDMMAQLSKVARVLGPRGLMPNPKSGTVTPNVVQAVEQAKAGRVEFRIDKQAIVHMAIGKVSFDAVKIEDNAKAAIDAILKAKPSAAKGTYVKTISLTTSMGPGIKLDVTKAIAAANPKR